MWWDFRHPLWVLHVSTPPKGPEGQPHGGPASSDWVGYILNLLPPSLLHTHCWHTNLLLANVYHQPPPPPILFSRCLGTDGRVEAQSGWQWLAQGLPQSATAFRTQKPDQRLEISDLYCKIIQTSHSSSSFRTLQSTPQDQGPMLQSLLHKVTL